MTPWPLAVILIWLAAFVAGQLLFKRAMESSRLIVERLAATDGRQKQQVEGYAMAYEPPS